MRPWNLHSVGPLDDSDESRLYTTLQTTSLEWKRFYEKAWDNLELTGQLPDPVAKNLISGELITVLHSKKLESPTELHDDQITVGSLGLGLCFIL